MLVTGRPRSEAELYWGPSPVSKSGRTAPRTRNCRRHAARRARRAECRLQALSPECGRLPEGPPRDTLYPPCAGLDVPKDTVVACVRHHVGAGRPRQEVRTFATPTQGLADLAAWLAAAGVTHAAMESTGVSWKPVFNRREGRVQARLGNAQHRKPRTAEGLLAAVGPTVEPFPTAAPLASGAGLGPGNNASAGTRRTARGRPWRPATGGWAGGAGRSGPCWRWGTCCW